MASAPCGSTNGPSTSQEHQSKRKRSSTPTNGSSSSSIVQSKPETDLLCPICIEILTEPQVTRCGHCFCNECIRASLERSPNCPKCKAKVESNDLVPNFLINELVCKQKMKLKEEEGLLTAFTAKYDGKETSFHKEVVCDAVSHLGLPEIYNVMKFLSERKNKLESESALTHQLILREFLSSLKLKKDGELKRIQLESTIIRADLQKIEKNIEEMQSNTHIPRTIEPMNLSKSSRASSSASESSESSPEGFNIFHDPHTTIQSQTSVHQKRQRMHSNFDHLSKVYFDSRSPIMTDQFDLNKLYEEEEEEDSVYDGLYDFSECVVKYTRYSTLRPLATLSYTSDVMNNASIVSSIEFDKDKEYFAIAGVTKRIKLYDYKVVVKDTIDVHYPCIEMVCGSKISCISWSSFYKNTLASSDYDCCVAVWDASTAQKTRTFHEHEKRCWSVDFNSMDTKLLASGSDDTRVKLWATNVEHSVSTLDAKANVCCVKFNPSSRYHLAFGSADHCVHYYDLRNIKTSLNVFKGHKKAVSYVKFLNKDTLVSASTDSQLKLWDIEKPLFERSFVGHVNEKNFVGLATDGDYITCGSENNSLYVYYKGLSHPLFSYKFNGTRSFLEKEKREDDASEFVSAVCWRQDSPIMVAANSQGTIKILELV